MRKYIFIKKKIKNRSDFITKKSFIIFQKALDVFFFLLEKMNNFYAKKLDLVFIKEKECFYEKRFQI